MGLALCMTMTIRIRKTEGLKGQVTPRLEGCLSSSSVQVSEAEVRRFMKENNKENNTVKLDLSNVTYIDELGVETLRNLGGPGLQLCNGSGLVTLLLNGGK